MDNLLCNLSRWVHRQDENFVTESFAYLLNYMLIHDGLTAQGLLQWLCFTPEESSFFNLERPTVTTQCNTDEGRPDIRIGIPAKVLIFLEVKKWSGLGREQLQRYRTVLSDANVPVTRLILLTVNPDEEGTALSDKHIRWPDVAEWLKKHPSSDCVSNYLVSQFVEFLKEQGMTMERIGWEYINGTKSFRHLITMLAKALEMASIKVHQKSATWEWMGFYLNEKDFLVAVAYDLPRYVRFRTSNAKCDPEKQKQLGRGSIDNGYLIFELDLESETSHFFSLSADSQLSLLTDFLTTCMRDAKACLVEDKGTNVTV